VGAVGQARVRERGAVPGPARERAAVLEGQVAQGVPSAPRAGAACRQKTTGRTATGLRVTASRVKMAHFENKRRVYQWRGELNGIPGSGLVAAGGRDCAGTVRVHRVVDNEKVNRIVLVNRTRPLLRIQHDFLWFSLNSIIFPNPWINSTYTEIRG